MKYLIHEVKYTKISFSFQICSEFKFCSSTISSSLMKYITEMGFEISRTVAKLC